MIDPELVWAPAVMTVAYFGHRVVVRYIDAAEKKNIRAEQRDERDNGTVAECVRKVEAMEKELHAMRVEQKTFLSNARAR